MRSRTRTTTITRAIGCAGIVIVLLVAFASTAFAGRWVIPPGQEALVMRMLGGELPGGCRLLGASIEKTEVRARFGCAGGEVRLSLRHPSDANGAAVRSTQLAVVPEGTPAPELLDAIGGRLRAEDAAWRWMAEGPSGHAREDAGLSPRARRLIVPLAAAAATAFAATLAAALWIARRLQRGAEGRAEEAVPARTILIEAAIVAAAAFVFLAVTVPPAPVHADTTRDLLMAADCLAGRPCDRGPSTTFQVIVQGALWTRSLAFWRARGLGVGAIQVILQALHAAAAAVIYASTRRRFGLPFAPAAAALFTAGAAFLIDANILWNPTLSPLPLAAFHAALVALAWDREGSNAARSIALAAGAAFALALTIDCHVAYVILVPALFAAIAGCAGRPAAALPAAALVLAGTLALDSRAAWAINARTIVDTGAAIPLGGMLLLATAAGALERPALARLAPRARALVFVGAASAYTTGATIAIFVLSGTAEGRRYLAPAVPGLALAIAAVARAAADFAAARAPRRLQRAGAVILQAVAVWIIARDLRPERGSAGDAWTVADVEAAAREVYRRAPTYRDVLFRTRTRSAGTVAALSAFEKEGARAAVDPDEDILMLLAPMALAPRDDPRVTTIDRGARAVVIAGVRPFLDRAKTTFCFAPRAGVSEDAGCADGSVPRAAQGRETPDERAYPALAAVIEAFPPELLRRFGGVRQTIVIGVKPFAGPAHRVALLDEASGYRITAVRGVRFRGALPGRQIVIEGVVGAGEIELAREEDEAAPRADRYWMPALVEVPEDEAGLVRLIEDAGVR